MHETHLAREECEESRVFGTPDFAGASPMNAPRSPPASLFCAPPLRAGTGPPPTSLRVTFSLPARQGKPLVRSPGGDGIDPANIGVGKSVKIQSVDTLGDSKDSANVHLSVTLKIQTMHT